MIIRKCNRFENFFYTKSHISFLPEKSWEIAVISLSEYERYMAPNWLSLLNWSKWLLFLKINFIFSYIFSFIFFCLCPQKTVTILATTMCWTSTSFFLTNFFYVLCVLEFEKIVFIRDKTFTTYVRHSTNSAKKNIYIYCCLVCFRSHTQKNYIGII